MTDAKHLEMLRELERKVLWLSTWTIHNANHLRPNEDGSVDLYFGPRAPAGKTSNWIPTEGLDFFLILRLYGPLDPWFDKSWRPGEIEELP